MSDYPPFKMPLEEVIRTQRSIRRVTQAPVEDQLLLDIIELGTHSPNTRNAQTWEFIIVKDPAIKKKLAEQNYFLYKRIKKGEEKRAAADPAHQKINKALDWAAENFENYPAMIVACYRGSRFSWPLLIAASNFSSILPAAQNIMLAARSVGLGANLATTPLWNNRKCRKILGLPVALTPAVLITLGWPQGKYGPISRRPVTEVTSLNSFGNRPWKKGEQPR
jgi:nitroreductase